MAYTYAVRSVQGADGLGDLFDFPNTLNIPKHPANDEQLRIVANWIVDVPYFFGVQFSGLITLGSGARLDVGCPIRFCPTGGYKQGAFTPPRNNFFVPLPGSFAYQTVDVRLRKDFPNFSGTTLGVTLDVFNVFNASNFSYPNFNNGHPDPNGLLSDPRRAQIGMEYNF